MQEATAEMPPDFEQAHAQTRNLDSMICRARLGFGWLDGVILLAFSCVVGVGVAFHEAWSDEAQAWLLAKDSSLWQLLTQRVAYEGSPGLWHSILWLLVRLHISYQGMHWVAGAFAVAGVYVFLRWSPFPSPLRFLLPFTFFLAYQNAVVARSYVLFPLLTFTAAALLTAKRFRPLALGLVLGLLANLSLHGFVEAIGLAVPGFFCWRRQQASSPCAQARPIGVTALALFLTLWLIAAFTGFPASDISSRPGIRVQKAVHHQKFEMNTRVAVDANGAAANQGEELIPDPLPQVIKTRQESRQMVFLKQAAVITYPLSESHLLGLGLFFLLLLQAVVSRKQSCGEAFRWAGLFPYLLMVVFFSRMYLMPWHTGTLFCSFLVSLWLTWPQTPPTLPLRLWSERVFVVALLLMSAEQVGWTTNALHMDVQGLFCGDKAAAEFLRSHAEGKKVAGFYFYEVGPVAYLGHPEYFNTSKEEYWLWSNRNRVNPEAPRALAVRPDYVLVGGSVDKPGESLMHGWRYLSGNQVVEGALDIFSDDYHIVDYYKAHGYHETHRFCGHAPMRAGSYEELCQIVLEPQS